VQFGVSIPPFAEPSRLVEMAVAAEESGWDGVFVWDHLRWIVALELDIHDPWALLAAMAMVTERVRLGTCITPVSRRRPHVLAKQLVTLDHLSAGRAMMGVGLGEPADSDFADFGDDDDRRARAARLDEGLTLIDGFVSGRRIDHDGVHYRVHAEMLPASVQRPRPPIFLAGTYPRRRPLERALHWDGFFPIGNQAMLGPADLERYLEGVERPPGWQLFASITGAHEPSDFETVGVTWLVQGAWPAGKWIDELANRIAAGPPR
jgi:alkanesulfonate monooxygenase SsuD/methylene tetrahydromethanopterin reductase-like flavin-dependent oxidoreductase (luciferase family)